MTAISDLEVVTEDTDGFIWTIKYPLVDKENSSRPIDTETRECGYHSPRNHFR